MERAVVELEDLKGIKPVNHSFGLVGKIIVDGRMSAQITKEFHDFISEGEDECLPSGDVYGVEYDLYKDGKQLESGCNSGYYYCIYFSLWMELGWKGIIHSD